ncbi:MAG: choice-of-anchor B family protein [Planctomycetota bacterium]
MTSRLVSASLLLVAMAPTAVLAQTGIFPTRNINLLGRLTHGEMGADSNAGNDIWGWTDSQTGREYALVGQKSNTAFVDITDGNNPLWLGSLPSATGSSVWRDIKVYDDHAFIVSDGNGPHGMQVFDLTRLRGVNSPQSWSPDDVYGGFRNAHNIAINEESGYAYVVGGNRAGGGLHILNIQNPTNAFHVGDFSSDGYTHDVQVVNYRGPDPDYNGREVAFASNVDTLTIVDVTNKSNTRQISRNSYDMVGYAHQGWLSEDHRFFFMNDEKDEQQFNRFLDGPRTLIWDVADLDNPVFVGGYEGNLRAIDHNLYVKGNHIYAANYSIGLRVLEMTDPANGVLTEVAYIDTYDRGNVLDFQGAWSSFPFFDSGKIVINDIYNGLFVVELDFVEVDLNGDGSANCLDIDLLTAAVAGGSSDATFDINGDGAVDVEDRDAWLFEAGAQAMTSVSGFLPGDANLDGLVDGADFIAWNNNKFTNHASWCGGDFNADGVVDGLDYVVWNDNKFTSALDSVPEPNHAMLLLVGLVGLLRRRR